MFTQNITSTKMSLFTGNHVEKNRRCCGSIRCCTIATMDYGTDPISSFGSTYPYPIFRCVTPPLLSISLKLENLGTGNQGLSQEPLDQYKTFLKLVKNILYVESNYCTKILNLKTFKDTKHICIHCYVHKASIFYHR